MKSIKQLFSFSASSLTLLSISFVTSFFLFVSSLGCDDESPESFVSGDCKVNAFNISFNPDPVDIVPGGTAEVVVNVSVMSNCYDFLESFVIESDAPLVIYETSDTSNDASNNMAQCILQLVAPESLEPGLYEQKFILTADHRPVAGFSSYWHTDNGSLGINVISESYDFDLSANPVNPTIQQDASGTVDISVNWIQGSGSVMLTATGGVIGQGENAVNASFNPNPVSGNMSVLALDVGSIVNPGDWPIKVVGNVNGIPKEVDLTLTVTPAEEVWNQQSFGEFNRLDAVHFSDLNRGIAVGYLGTIVKTADGGAYWEELDHITDNHLFGVQFFDEMTGYIVGENNTILFTEDGGSNWNDTLNSDTINTHYRGLHFLSRYKGWVVSQYIQFTIDGGEHWDLQLDEEFGRIWHDVDFGSNTNGAVVGYKAGIGGLIYYTSDGTSWQPGNHPSIGTQINAISFVNPATAYASTSGGEVLKTIDGGANWTVIFTSDISYLWGISFADENNGWVASNKVYRTTNGGSTWTDELHLTRPLFDVYFINNETGFAVGQSGMIFRRK